MRIHHHHVSIGGRQPEGLPASTAGAAAAQGGAPVSRALQNPLEAMAALEEWRILDSHEQGEEPRWPGERMPLGVHIEPHPDMPGIEDLLFSVMRQWEAASMGLVRLERRALNPDIRVQWSDTVVRGRDYEVGHTDLQTRSGGMITGAVITLIREPLIDRHLDPGRREKRLAATILHETGHALGLRHSERKEDVMHHRGWQRPCLSTEDARRIRRLYQRSHLTLS